MQTVSKHTTPSARMPVVKGVSKALPDAVDLLVDDHKQVKKLFKEYEKLSKRITWPVTRMLYVTLIRR